jgi:DNA-directed RNA polymerase specialized sigma24 family protein
MRALDDLTEGGTEERDSIHLEESARGRNVRGSDEPHLQYHQPDESFTEETVIADRRVPTPEEIASNDEMVGMIELALRGAGRADREVFILHALEGFSVDEIAAITDRKPEQIQSSIAAAREHLRKSPPLASQFASKFLQRTNTV